MKTGTIAATDFKDILSGKIQILKNVVSVRLSPSDTEVKPTLADVQLPHLHPPEEVGISGRIDVVLPAGIDPNQPAMHAKDGWTRQSPPVYASKKDIPVRALAKARNLMQWFPADDLFNDALSRLIPYRLLEIIMEGA